MKQFDIVRVTKDLPNGELKGQIGTILEIHDENNFEVEICDSNGITIFSGALSQDFLEIVVMPKS